LPDIGELLLASVLVAVVAVSEEIIFRGDSLAAVFRTCCAVAAEQASYLRSSSRLDTAMRAPRG
jgi:hypothetical protein